MVLYIASASNEQALTYFQDMYSYCSHNKGQVGRSMVETPELLLEKIGEQYVTVTLNLTQVPNLVPKFKVGNVICYMIVISLIVYFRDSLCV